MRFKDMRFTYFVLLVMLGGALMGCGRVDTGKTVSVLAPDFFGVGDELARQLIDNRRHSFGREEKLIFTTVVNLDDLHQTSKFGRALSESLATRLFQYGYGVVELRKVASVLIKDRSGELVLSRESERLAKEYEAHAIVAGTYSMTPNSVIINVKILDALSQEVLSVAGLELQRSHTVNYLLADKSGMADSELSGYENF